MCTCTCTYNKQKQQHPSNTCTAKRARGGESKRGVRKVGSLIDEADGREMKDGARPVDEVFISSNQTDEKEKKKEGGGGTLDGD